MAPATLACGSHESWHVGLAPPAPAHEVLVSPRARTPLQQLLRLPHVALQVALGAAPDGSGCR